jgi:hypothetical protein
MFFRWIIEFADWTRVEGLWLRVRCGLAVSGNGAPSAISQNFQNQAQAFREIYHLITLGIFPI